MHARLVTMHPSRSLPLSILAMLALALAAWPVGDPTEYPTEHPTEYPTGYPIGDLAGALARARRGDRPLLVHFAAADLPAGAALWEESLADPQRRAALERYCEVLVLDAGEHGELFERSFGEAGRLGTSVLDSSGEPMAALPGYASPLALLALARSAAELHAGWRANAADPWERSRMRMHLHSWPAAARDLRGLLDRGPPPAREARLRERLARCLVRQGLVAQTFEELALCAVLLPGREDATALVTEALAHIAAREPRLALERLERARALAPGGTEPDARLLARGIARHHAQRAGGLGDLRALLDRHPRSTWRLEAQRRIEHMLTPPSQHTH